MRLRKRKLVELGPDSWRLRKMLLCPTKDRSWALLPKQSRFHSWILGIWCRLWMGSGHLKASKRGVGRKKSLPPAVVQGLCLDQQPVLVPAQGRAQGAEATVSPWPAHLNALPHLRQREGLQEAWRELLWICLTLVSKSLLGIWQSNCQPIRWVNSEIFS